VRHNGKQVRVCIEALTELYAAKTLDLAFQTELEEKVEPLCTQLALEAASDFVSEWKEYACYERKRSIPSMERPR
jgi:transcription initiation factor TFIID subunit TAF12